ncbi:MAG: DNA replication and repair protein RecF [Bacteroidota bacterium]
MFKRILSLQQMFLREIRLTQFKNYPSAKVNLSPQLNCFVGKNGMGKTNLLDAIYYLCMCKSNFGIRDRQVVQHGTSFFRLEGRFAGDQEQEIIVAKVIPGKKKEMERNGVAYQRLFEHIGLIPVVMIVPDDTLLVSEGSEGRRKFLDNTLSQLDRQYLEQLLAYNKVLRQRNAALKQFAKNGYFDAALIETYNKQMLNPAAFIHQRRQAFLENFDPVFKEYYQIISKDAEKVDCTYVSRLAANSLSELFVASREKDRILQRTTAGIHKDDLKFIINGYALKTFASQGQLKSFVLALKLAQFEFLRKEKKIAPILLLDDIFDKLDRHRVEQLIGLLLERQFGQIFITDTHENRLEEIVKKFDSTFLNFKIEDGVVHTLAGS